MKKLYFLVVLLMTYVSSVYSQVNDNPCYGKSNFQFVVNGTTVSFYPINAADTTIAHLWKFGDGSASELPNPVHTYPAGGMYRVVHYIKSKQFNCYDSTVKEITFPTTISCDRLIPRFEWKADSANPLLVKFYNVSQPAGTSLTFQSKWDFGDGTYSGLFDPSHQYAQAGTYKVCLTISFPNTNCVKTYCGEVVVTKPCNLEPYFVWGPEPGTSPLALRFTNKTLLPATGFQLKWSFGDGTYSSELNPLHVYPSSGTYKVCLTIYTSSNCVREICKEVTIASCDLKPDFTWKNDSLIMRAIRFANQTVMPTTGVQVQWSFGDGTFSTDLNPVHEYVQPGVYTVCLIVSSGSTCKREICKEVSVQFCNMNPTFSWAVSPEALNKINFTNQTTWSSGIGAQAYWSFGDGTFSNEWSPSHVFSKSGTYRVCLRITFSNDCFKEICKDVVIRTCDVQPDFTWRLDSANAGQVVKFSNQTPVTISNPVRVNWNFGDGTTSTEWNPVHSYVKPGTYKVCLLVEFFTGCVREVCKTIVINPPIDCMHASSFKVLNQTMQMAQSFGFAAEVNQSVFRYTWTFGDGTGALGPNTTHTYKQPGRYTVCLTAYKDDQCASTACKEVVAGEGAGTCEQTYLRYEYNYLNTAGNALKFTAISNQTIVSQKWIIQKSNGTTPQVIYTSNPTYTFQDTGWYKVCLQAVTANYCVKEYCQMVRIQYVPDVCILTITPNPATSYITFRYEVPSSQTIAASVIDLTGVRRSTFYLSAAAGINTFTLPVGALPAGYYYLEVRAGNRICKGRFQKMN